MAAEKMVIRRSWVALAALLAVVGCAPSSAHVPTQADINRPLRVVCTTGLVGDLVANLGGKHVAVEALMGPGVDPHLYRGTLADTQKLERADVVFYNGLHLEGRLAEALEKLAARKPVFAVTEKLVADTPQLLRKPAEFEGNYDPHVWFDVSLWSKCAAAVTDRLIELDPPNADDYRKHASDYGMQFDALHKRCVAEIATIPREQALMVTAHDAFGYFGAAYGIEVRGLQGISTADEADMATVNELVDLLAERKVKAVFVESSVSPKTIQSLIEGCASRGHRVALGGELFSDALGPADSPEGNYLGMVEHNVSTIVEALK
jgi:manganese/zinc/iron transport system substrate-binding protein